MMTIVGRCKDCNHCITRIDPLGLELPIHFCDLTMTCDGKPEHKKTLAYAEDKEDYHAVLIVSLDFGCVQFRHRELEL